jgi:hypothetical protein
MTATTLGISTEEIRNLALATTNVTFPLESVKNTFDLLTKAGVRDTEMLKESATAFDTLGDATGNSAEVVADILVPALKSFGEQLPRNASDLDKFTWLTKNTTVELSEFGSVMSYVAAYGKDLDLTSNDLIATLAALEAQGISGSAATKVFRTAITEATREGKSLNEVLGITQAEIDGYKSKLGDASGVTQDYADVANTQYTIMDKIKQKWSELTLQAGSFLTPLEPILAAMTALGPAMIFLSSSAGTAAVKWGLHTTALVAHKVALLASAVAIKMVTAAQWLWNAALSANPIGLVVVAIGALVAAGIALYKNWDKVTAFFEKAWDKMKSVTLKAVDSILGTLQKFVGWLPGLGDKIDDAREQISKLIDAEAVKKEAEEAKKALEDYSDEAIAQRRRAFENQEYLDEEARRNFEERIEYEKNLAQERYRNAIQRLEDEYGATEQVSDDKKSLARAETDNIISELNKQANAARGLSNEKIAGYREEYQERVRLLDAETDALVSNLNDQLSALDDEIKQEERAREDAAREEARSELVRRVALSGSNKQVLQELQDFEAETRRIALEREQEDTRESLRAQIDAARDAAADKKEQWESELEAKIELENESLHATLERLETQKTAEQEALDGTLNRIEQEKQAFISAEEEKLQAKLRTIHAEESRATVGEAGVGLASEALPGFAGGGMITEPTVLVRESDMQPYAIAGESGAEIISPAQVINHGERTTEISPSVSITGNNFYVRDDRDIDRIAEQLVTRMRLRSGLRS